MNFRLVTCVSLHLEQLGLPSWHQSGQSTRVRRAATMNSASGQWLLTRSRDSTEAIRRQSLTIGMKRPTTWALMDG